MVILCKQLKTQLKTFSDDPFGQRLLTLSSAKVVSKSQQTLATTKALTIAT